MYTGNNTLVVPLLEITYTRHYRYIWSCLQCANMNPTLFPLAIKHHQIVQLYDWSCYSNVPYTYSFCHWSVRKVHWNTISLLSQCHCIYDQNFITEAQCKELGIQYNTTELHKTDYLFYVPTETAIPQFMENFRASFPDSSITPKMHLLEDHVIPWAKKWHVGFGLLGEQGAESIHARFNTLQRTYHSIPDKVQQLLAIMKEQLLFIAPRNVVAIPQ